MSDICFSLTSRTMIISRSIHVVANGIYFSFLWLSKYSVVNMDHIFSYSSVNRHVGCFHVLAIVNSGCYEHRGACLFGLEFCLDICSGAEKAMSPHSSTLAWKIPWMEEPGGLQSMGSLRVGHN